MAKTALGRGLDSLIGPRSTASRLPEAPLEIPLDLIDRSPEQPRRTFDRESLVTLSASIKEHGVLQPIVVGRLNGRYRLIAGERRVQAARLAGLTRVPAVVRDDAIHSALELALIENIQRADLNAIEEAQAYRLLMDNHGLTQETIAQRVGRSRAAISNTLRLLSAPAELQDAVIQGKISEGHLRALLPLSGEQAIIALRQVIQNELNVRQTEGLARRLARAPRRRRHPDPEVMRAQDELRAALGTKVAIEFGRRGGRIALDFYSDEEFERLRDLLLRAARSESTG